MKLLVRILLNMQDWASIYSGRGYTNHIIGKSE